MTTAPLLDFDPVTDVSPFDSTVSTASDGIEYDHLNRYLLPDPEAMAGNVAWSRVTTFAGAIDDTYRLSMWQQNQVILGMGRRPDLFAKAATVSTNDLAGGRILSEIREAAHESAGTSAGANVGTALHHWVEARDRGETPLIPSPWDRDVAAYEALVKTYGLPPVESAERVVVIKQGGSAPFNLAGRYDQIRASTVYDLKTGQQLDFIFLKTAVQLATYAHAQWVYDPSTRAYVPAPPVNQGIAYVIHVPSGSGTASLWTCDIGAAWEVAVELCAAVRKVRNVAKRWWKQVPAPAPAATPVQPTPAAVAPAVQPTPVATVPAVQPAPVVAAPSGQPLAVIPGPRAAQPAQPAAKGGRKCGKCGQTGHNARTCTGAPPAPAAQPEPGLPPDDTAPAPAVEECTCPAPDGWTKVQDDPEVWACGRCGKPSRATTMRMRQVHADDKAFVERIPELAAEAAAVAVANRQAHEQQPAPSTPGDGAVDNRGDQPWQPAAEQAAQPSPDLDKQVIRNTLGGRLRVAMSKPELAKIRDEAVAAGVWDDWLDGVGKARLAELLNGAGPAPAAPEPAQPPAPPAGEIVVGVTDPFAPQAGDAPDPFVPKTLIEQIMAAATVTEIQQIRKRAADANEWRPEHVAAGLARCEQLGLTVPR